MASFMNTFLPKLTEELKERKSRQFQIKIHIDFIKRELELLAAAIDDHELSGKGTCSREVSVLIKQARELARDTEDCIYVYLYPKTASSRLGSKEFAMKIEAYRNEATKLYEKLSAPTQDTNIEPQDQHVEPSRFLTNGETLHELLELVQEKARPPSTRGKGISTFTLEGALDTGPPLSSMVKRRVISIVGFNGIGKTRLAKKVHEHTEVRNTYNCRAMVTASVNGAEEVLEEILKQVAPASLAKRKQGDNLSEHLAKILRRNTTYSYL